MCRRSNGKLFWNNLNKSYSFDIVADETELIREGGFYVSRRKPFRKDQQNTYGRQHTTIIYVDSFTTGSTRFLGHHLKINR